MKSCSFFLPKNSSSPEQKIDGLLGHLIQCIADVATGLHKHLFKAEYFELEFVLCPIVVIVAHVISLLSIVRDQDEFIILIAPLLQELGNHNRLIIVRETACALV